MKKYDYGIQNKNCIFLCADSTHGRVLCRNLARMGLNLGLIDLHPKDSSDLADELSGTGIKAVSAQVTAGEQDSFNEAIQKINGSLGSIDFLLCSYYFDMFKNTDIKDLELQNWDRLAQDWIYSYFLCAKAVLPYFIKKKRGKIIFVNTTAAYTGEGEGEGELTAHLSLYYAGCGSAITGIMTSMARDIIPMGIGVNGLALGSSFQKDEERIMNSLVFLLSDFSNYSCAQTIRLY